MWVAIWLQTPSRLLSTCRVTMSRITVDFPWSQRCNLQNRPQCISTTVPARSPPMGQARYQGCYLQARGFTFFSKHRNTDHSRYSDSLKQYIITPIIPPCKGEQKWFKVNCSRCNPKFPALNEQQLAWCVKPERCGVAEFRKMCSQAEINDLYRRYFRFQMLINQFP